MIHCQRRWNDTAVCLSLYSQLFYQVLMCKFTAQPFRIHDRFKRLTMRMYEKERVNLPCALHSSITWFLNVEHNPTHTVHQQSQSMVWHYPGFPHHNWAKPMITAEPKSCLLLQYKDFSNVFFSLLTALYNLQLSIIGYYVDGGESGNTEYQIWCDITVTSFVSLFYSVYQQTLQKRIKTEKD